jgi:hypothetical protein
MNKFKAFRQHNEYKWLPKHGKAIKVADMTDSHIANSIALLEKAEQQDCAAYIGLLTEQHKRKLANAKLYKELVGKEYEGRSSSYS